MSRKLKLHGAFAGQTIILANTKFIDGIAELNMSPEDFEGVSKYLKLCYQAKEVTDDGCGTPESDQSERSVQDLSSNLPPDGRSPEGESDVWAPDVDADSGDSRGSSTRDGYERSETDKVKAHGKNKRKSK
jgi:hypothetical protein